MRLLELKNHDDLSLREFFEDNIPRYAILSHTWRLDGEEVIFKDLAEGTGKRKAGFNKIQFCGKQATNDSIQYFWVDTCCIDKSSSAELSEAINSMFRWYRNAAKCYVYLSDVSIGGSSQLTWESAFLKSRWFTRGWTLQELIAPASVEFFSVEGKRLGDKKSLERQIHEITGIAVQALQGSSLSDFTIAERMSWAAKRQTTRKEDGAYSLLGIFDIYMPLIYGEGRENAFNRLKEEINKASKGTSLAPTLALYSKQEEARSSSRKLLTQIAGKSKENFTSSVDITLSDTFPHLRPQYLVVENRLSEHFVGRTAELSCLRKTFDDSKSSRRRAAIHGMPGMGKSQIMYQYVALYGAMYETVFCGDATTISTLQTSYVDFFKALKLPDLDKSRDPDQRTRIAAVKEWLRGRTEWLLIFDNLQEKDYNEWKSFLPGGDTGHVLVTTRSEWAATTFTSGSENLCINLDKLDPTSASDLLLKAALLEKEKDRLANLATIIVERLWFIPLTIEFVGRGNQSEEKLRTLLSVLEDRKLRESLEEKYSQDTGVLAYSSDPTTFLTLYTFERLTPKTQEIWRVMAFMDPSWYSEYLFHTIPNGSGLPLGYLVSDPQELTAAFEELLGGGIIQRIEGRDGYWTHDLIHEIGRVFLRTRDKESEYASFAASWLCAAFPEYRNFGKWDREKAFLKHAEVCTGFADELHLADADLQRLFYKSSNFARFIGNYTTAERLARRGVDLFKEIDPGVRDVRNLFAARDSLALAFRRQSKFREARYILEMNLDEETHTLGAKDKDTLATLNEIGWGMFLAGDAEGAEFVLREAMQKRVEVLTEGAGPTQHTFQNLAACLTKLHKYKEAEELYKKAEAGHVKLFTEDHHWVQHIRSNIGQLYEAEGRLQEAMNVYRGVYNWRMKNSNFGDFHPDTLRIAVNLARVNFKLGRWESASSLARRTRVKFDRVFGSDHPETKELDMLIWEIEKGNQG